MSAGVETGLDVGYCRHRPEDTPLYQIVERYNPLFEALRAEQGRALPAFVLCRPDAARATTETAAPTTRHPDFFQVFARNTRTLIAPTSAIHTK